MAHRPRHAPAPMPGPVFHEPIFSEDDPTPSPTGFETKHPSDGAIYANIEDLLSKSVVDFPKTSTADDALYDLETAYGPEHGPQVTAKIRQAGKIIFHVVGDSGASNVRKYHNEMMVADQVTVDCNQADVANKPAFLFHLGDVVYDFGESQYYYEQFYDPFRNYTAPIFAIPGNHDSFIVPGTPADEEPLKIFQRNFCADTLAVTPEARSLHRTAMTQPGVYFTLDSPYVRIVSLFSNALEDPGVISSEGGKWQKVPDYQLDFLRAQLQRIRQENYAGAVLLATHHPAFSYAPPPKTDGTGGSHSSSAAMLKDIDTICREVGVYPHAFLSGHAHNYQRYTRMIRFGGEDYDVPFIVCGDGGHNVNPLVRASKGKPAQEPNAGSSVKYLDAKTDMTVNDLLIEKYDDRNYGYLRIHVDERELKIGFHRAESGSVAQSRYDMVTVDIASHTMVAN